MTHPNGTSKEKDMHGFLDSVVNIGVLAVVVVALVVIIIGTKK